MTTREGWTGWDEYAPFYDWENARTLGRRDVPFWRGVALQSKGPVLELGCGTGRISLPLVRAGVRVVGLDRSAQMLARASARWTALARRVPDARRSRLRLVRGDMRELPFAAETFNTVLAPYGVLQSLVREKDLASALTSVAGVLKPGGLFGVDLVPDVPNWREYSNRIQLKGRSARGSHLTLVESVRQEPRRHLTIFEQTYIERRGERMTKHRFELTFRTLPVPAFTRRLERSGFRIEAVLGDYRGGPWDERADVWIMLARRL
ncbi:MAG: class I SAM-dependent methyltransferase [Vicinamibacterales bacterium]